MMTRDTPNNKQIYLQIPVLRLKKETVLNETNVPLKSEEEITE